MLKVKNIPFVGGDTAIFEFDFGTKVFGSTIECPMKLYYSFMSTVQTPSNQTNNYTTGWRELTTGYGDQSFFDKLKLQDGQCASAGSTVSNTGAQIMIELNLTPLCTALFGGSTNAMRAALKSIISIAYAKGQGIHNGVLDYTVALATWSNSYATWSGLATNSRTTAITPLGYTEQGNGDRIDNNNKMYFLLSVYSSDGTTASELDLDYINIKLQFSRVPDVIAPIPITLPDTWSMLIKDVALNYLPLENAINKFIINIGNQSNIDVFSLFWSSIQTFRVWCEGGFNAVNGTGVDIPTKKFETQSFLVICSQGTVTIKSLLNGGTVKTFNIPNKLLLTGLCNLYLGMNYTGNNGQLDGFANSLIFLPNKTFSDVEAESVLRGTTEGFEEDELVLDFNNPQWTKPSNAIVSSDGKSITVTATQGVYAESILKIPVFPNNKYTLQGTYSAGAIINARQQYNNILISYQSLQNGVYSLDFTTGSNINNITLDLFNMTASAGTFTFSNLSFKLKM